MALSENINTLEKDKFIECDNGQTAIATEVCNGEDNPVNTQPINVALDLDVDNLSMPLASTEYSYTIPDGTKRILVRPRENNSLQIAFVATESASEYLTISGSASLEIDGIKLTSKTLYIQSGSTNTNVEILIWT